MRVLVIDDNVDVLLSLVLVLESAGHEAESLRDAREALRVQRTRPADVITTDIFMPEQDGLETILQLRSEFPDVKILAMSGGGELARQDYLSVARHAGADAMLRKPCDPALLLKTLESVARAAA